MRIDLYGPAAVPSEVSGAGAASATPKPATAVPVDTATLSAGSLSVPSLTTRALDSSEVRLAKVATLTHAVSSGSYSLDPSKIAHAIATSEV